MRYYEVLAKNWRTVFGNPLLWVFGLFAAAIFLYPTYTFQSDNLGLECAVGIGSLFSLAISVIGTAGLIHIADNIPHESELTFRNVWKRSVGSFSRIVAIYLILALVLLIPFLCLFFSIRSWVSEGLPFLLFNWAISPVLIVVGTLSACGIVVTGLGVSASLRKGLTVFRKHVVDMLLLGVAYVAVPTIVTVAGFVVLKAIHLDMNLPSPVPIAVQTYNELLRIPAIIAIRSITYFIMVPVWTILVTLAYKEMHWW